MGSAALTHPTALLAACLLAAPAPASADLFEASQLPAPQGRINHAPGIAELPSGDLLACWYSGSTEGAEDAEILCSRSSDAGQNWQAAVVAAAPGERAADARNANKSVGNVALYLDANARLWLINGVIQRWDWPIFGNLCLNWYCGRIDARFSLDEGRSWTRPMRLDDRVGALPRAKPLHDPALGDLVPVYDEDEQNSAVLVTDLAAARAGEVPPTRLLPIPGEQAIQPSLLRLPDGALRAYLRDQQSDWVRSSVFNPATQSWSPVQRTDLPNPDSGLDAFVDAQGEIAVVGNPSDHDRLSLAVAVGTDGLHFPRRCTLVEPGAQGEAAYPAVLTARDGSVHIVYSAQGKREIRHLRFDAAWLEHCLSGR